jgi:hypothetical protein
MGGTRHHPAVERHNDVARSPEGERVSAPEVADLVKALVWPVLIVALIVLFRKQLQNFANRLTHIRVGGQEFIARTLETSQLLVRSIPLTVTRPESVPKATEDQVIQLAASDPQMALVRVGREIDRSIRLVALSGNWLQEMEQQPDPLWRRLSYIADRAGWDPNVRAATLIFALLYEAAVAGDEAVSKQDMKPLVDQGLTILGLINAIPRETRTVIVSGLPIFADEELKERFPDRSAVVMRTTQSDGRELVQAFFTSRPQYYKPGMKVGYEWRENPPKEELRGWVADPTSTTPKGAVGCTGWDFHGRDLAEFD